MSNPVPKDLHEKAKKEVDKLTAHRGMATWGERLVPLAQFRTEVQRYGRQLNDNERRQALESYLAPTPDRPATEGPYSKVAIFGGIYNNSHGLVALLEDATRRGAEAIYCLGDLGGFGPHPEKIWPLLVEGQVLAIQGNYEESLSSGRDDCNCGYADPRDNHFAEISYRYTAENSSPAFKAWMGTLPKRRRMRIGEREVLLIHGSPRRINEFLFYSTTPTAFLEVLLDQHHADALLCTHTGLHWHRHLPSGRDVVNVGVIGRPANDGRTHVWYCLLSDHGENLGVELIPLRYDHESLAREMRAENLPEAFIDTIRSGWWTTCLEILPSQERAASKF